jgi:lipoate-protein ligase A
MTSDRNPRDPLSIVRDHSTGDAPLDTATSRAILLGVEAGRIPETLEIGMPHRVVAFGKHDTLTDGFPEAVAIAREHGYDPTVRIAGGLAVVFGPTIVRFAWTVRSADPAGTMRDRYRELAESVVATLDSLGIRGRIGEIPNEYCAGEFSVSIRGHRKVMGVGQRLTRNAAQVGGMIVVSDPDDINRVLVPIYAALGVPIDPNATGSIADERLMPPAEVADAFAEHLARSRPLVETQVDPETRDHARELRSRHVPSVP